MAILPGPILLLQIFTKVYRIIIDTINTPAITAGHLYTGCRKEFASSNRHPPQVLRPGNPNTCKQFTTFRQAAWQWSYEYSTLVNLQERRYGTTEQKPTNIICVGQVYIDIVPFQQDPHHHIISGDYSQQKCWHITDQHLIAV